MAATRVTHMVGANLSGSKADKVIKVRWRCGGRYLHARVCAWALLDQLEV